MYCQGMFSVQDTEEGVVQRVSAKEPPLSAACLGAAMVATMLAEAETAAATHVHSFMWPTAVSQQLWANTGKALNLLRSRGLFAEPAPNIFVILVLSPNWPALVLSSRCLSPLLP